MTASLFQSPPQTLLQHPLAGSPYCCDTQAAAPFPGRWRKVVSFFVPGIPRPGGSKTAQAIYKNGKPLMAGNRVITTTREAGKHTAAWRSTVADFARQAYRADPLDGVFGLQIEFRMPRPKCHYGGGKNANILKLSAPHYHRSKPDATKTTRSTEDALTGILWRDDSTIGEQRIRKIYAAAPGAQITLWVLEDGGASC